MVETRFNAININLAKTPSVLMPVLISSHPLGSDPLQNYVHSFYPQRFPACVCNKDFVPHNESLEEDALEED